MAALGQAWVESPPGCERKQPQSHIPTFTADMAWQNVEHEMQSEEGLWPQCKCQTTLVLATSGAKQARWRGRPCRNPCSRCG